MRIDAWVDALHSKVPPLRSFRFQFVQHSPTTRLSVERTADKAFLLSDRVELSSAEARVEEIQGGYVALEATQGQTLCQSPTDATSGRTHLNKG